MTRNNDTALHACNWNGHVVKLHVSNDWRASPVPAAAVIPAPIAYANVVAVKKLVVGFLFTGFHPSWMFVGEHTLLALREDVYFEEIRVFQAG